MDIIGKTFGRATVLRRAERKGYVVCSCSCGTVFEVRATQLTMKKQPTRSCGCIQREAARRIGTQDIAANSAAQIATNMKYRTNFQVIEATELPRNNTSGVKGIWYDKSRHQWQAYINIHRRRINLGRYATKEEATAARKAAEETYFAPLIEAKNAETIGSPC